MIPEFTAADGRASQGLYQMVSGVAKGSKYYPRGVTAILWLS